MHSYRVEQQPERALTTSPAGQNRPQEGVLDTDQRHPAPGGDTLAAPGGRTCAPDKGAVVRSRQAEVQIVPGKLQHPGETPVAQEGEVLVAKPPGDPGQRVKPGPVRHGPVSRWNWWYWPGSKPPPSRR